MDQVNEAHSYKHVGSDSLSRASLWDKKLKAHKVIAYYLSLFSKKSLALFVGHSITPPPTPKLVSGNVNGERGGLQSTVSVSLRVI